MNAALVERGCAEKAGKCLRILIEECLALGDVATGKEVLSQFRPTRVSAEETILLIRLCALCGTAEQALTLFQALSEPKVVAWNAILNTLLKLGRSQHAINLFAIIPSSIVHTSHTYVTVLQACSKAIHVHLLESQIVERGFDRHLHVCNSLIHAYAQCGCLESARHVFDRLRIRSVVTWCAMISGYARHACTSEALQLFHHMQLQAVEPNQVTFISILKACAKLHEGKILHLLILCRGMELQSFIANSLLDMYAKCGSFELASSFLERSCDASVVTWTAMIGGCIQHGRLKEALRHFDKMLENEVEPNEVTFVNILKACSSLADLITGRLIYGFVVERHLCLQGPLGNAIIDMYGKCGGLQDAHHIFDGLHHRNVITWSAMMVAYSHNGFDEDALYLFQRMQHTDILPDKIILACALKACSTIVALEFGKLIHSHLLENDVMLDNKLLIELYAKCGCIEDACRAFDTSQKNSLATWNTIILGCCESCKFDRAKYYFDAMYEQGIKPNHMTLSCLLFFCSHMGLVTDGFSLFKEMSKQYHACPKLEHFVSLVHLLGGTGYMDEAKCLLATMPPGPGPVGYRSLLSQCKAHSQGTLGQQCFEHVASGDQREAAGYVLMSSIHIQPGSHEGEETEGLRKYVNAWKKPAKACIEVSGKVHSFSVKDECHPLIDDIHAKLRLLRVQIMAAGHMHGL